MMKAAVCFVQRSDRKILAVWNLRHNAWCLPGGKVERLESPQDAAARELMEETGLSARSLHYAYKGVTEIPGPLDPERGRAALAYLFIATFGADPEPEAEREPGCPTKWMTRAEFLAQTPFPAWTEAAFLEARDAVRRLPQ